MLAGLTHIASMSGLKSWVGHRNGIVTPLQSSTNGAATTAIPTADQRRQVAAAKARMPPPQTRLARQPLQALVDRPEARTNDSAAPNNAELEDDSGVMAEQFDSQDLSGGVFDTDAEGMDESTLSVLQVKDSQVVDRHTAHPTTSWATRQPEQDQHHPINQADRDRHDDAQMGNYQDDNAPGTEDGEISELEEVEEISDDETTPPEEDAAVVGMNLARELREMKADSKWRPLVERPKDRANIAPQQRQTIPKLAGHHHPEPIKGARGRAQNGDRNTHNSWSESTSGESNPDDDATHNKRAQDSRDRQSRPHQPRKRPDSQPKVVRVPQVKQPQQVRPPPAQQSRGEVGPRLVKQDQPLNQGHAPDDGPHSPSPDAKDFTRDVKRDLSDADNDKQEDANQNAAPPPTRTLLPEHPPPNPTKRRLSPDYDPATLHSMPYTDLQTQPFDHDPNPPPCPLPERLLSAPLASKLHHITTLSDAERRTFFATLSLAEWEESGDWFVERFSELVRKMKEARTERRRVAGEFEDEVARREEFVRRSREGVEGEMRKMRKGGEDVLRSKVS